MTEPNKAPAVEPLSEASRQEWQEVVDRGSEDFTDWEVRCARLVLRLDTTIRALQAEVLVLRGLLEGWQDLLEDGAVNCGEDQATEQWEKVGAALLSSTAV